MAPFATVSLSVHFPAAFWTSTHLTPFVVEGQARSRVFLTAQGAPILVRGYSAVGALFGCLASDRIFDALISALLNESSLISRASIETIAATLAVRSDRLAARPDFAYDSLTVLSDGLAGCFVRNR